MKRPANDRVIRHYTEPSSREPILSKPLESINRSFISFLHSRYIRTIEYISSLDEHLSFRHGSNQGTHRHWTCSAIRFRCTAKYSPLLDCPVYTQRFPARRHLTSCTKVSKSKVLVRIGFVLAISSSLCPSLVGTKNSRCIHVSCAHIRASVICTQAHRRNTLLKSGAFVLHPMPQGRWLEGSSLSLIPHPSLILWRRTSRKKLSQGRLVFRGYFLSVTKCAISATK